LDSLIQEYVLVLQIAMIFPVFYLKTVSVFFTKCSEFSPYKPDKMVQKCSCYTK